MDEYQYQCISIPTLGNIAVVRNGQLRKYQPSGYHLVSRNIGKFVHRHLI